MLKQSLKLLVVSGVALAGPASAAQDAGLQYQNSRDAGVRTSLASQLNMTLRLGHRQTAKGSDRFNLRMSAGPVALTNDGRRSTANLLSVNLSPGYKAELAIGGYPLVTRYTAAGFKKAKARGLDGKDHKGVSTLGYIAIGVGTLAAATLVAGALILEDIGDCSDGNCE